MNENTNGESVKPDSQTAQEPDAVEPKKSWKQERREERQSRREERREWRHEHNQYGSIVWAIILIMIGFIFLLNNVGIVPWSIWSNMWKFWPVFLILCGIQIVLGKSRIAAVFIALITLILCGGVMLISAMLAVNSSDLKLNINSDWLRSLENSLHIDLKTGGEQLTKTDLISDSDFENIKSRELGIQIGSGAFNLTDSSSVDYFSANSEYYENYGVPVLESSSSNSKLKINFSTEDSTTVNIFNWGTSRNYDLTLGKPSVVTDLNVDLASGSGDIDLNSVLLNDANVNVSSGHLNLVLANDSIPTGDFSLHLSSGNLEVTLPEDLGLEIEYTVSSGNLTVRGENLDERGSYKSENYSTATKQLKLLVTVSSGTMSIE